MIEDRPHRPAAEPLTPGALPRRLRGWFGMSEEPPLRPARPARLDIVRRSWAAAYWQARVSVRAGVPLDDYLRSRLARYSAALPVPRAQLPLSVEVEDGEILVGEAAPERRPAEPPADGDAWLAALVHVEGPAVRQEVAELEIRLASIEVDADAARRRDEELSRRLAADVAAGTVCAPPQVEATAEQLGRPPVSSAAPQAGLRAFATASIAAETWQIALPLLRAAGVDPATLGASAARKPAETAFAFAFALGIAGALLALAWAGFDAASVLASGEQDRARRRYSAAGAAGAALLSIGLAAAVAALPGGIGGLPPAVSTLLLASVPVGAALALRAARSLATRRGLELTDALEWDRTRARALADRARRLEELDWAEAEEHDLEREREAARRRLRTIGARAAAADRLASEPLRRRRAELSRVAQSLVSALELDRYEFLRQAAARGATDLIAPRRRRAGGDGRRAEPPRPDATPAAPVAVPVPEGGRLAS
ncbi:hypothetical protein [Anaeromyxobacter dehalogenans]|uniref:hypothetical protein n=1 Tax=Anaeromyxobacter dehalogenans TaxID=161493 RepID=UPI0002FFBE63|nr:hypothetical protein [Anaeromyxobacter dehalogenans]